MGMMKRMGTIFGAKMTKVLDRAENPNETLDYSYQKQLQMLQDVKRSLAEIVTSKRRIQLEADSLKTESAKREDQAKAALSAGNEDLARQALQRKQIIDSQLSGIDGQVTGLQDQQQKLEDASQRLQTKIETFRSQKEVIKAQYTAASAQVKISEAATGIGEEFADVGMAVQRAQDKTQEMQARASAMDELMDSGALQDVMQPGGSDDIDQKLAQLTSGSQVDAQMADLKHQLGMSTPAQLPAPEEQPTAALNPPAEGQS
jgi:phage shock protein A